MKPHPDVLHIHGKPMLLSELALALSVPQSRTTWYVLTPSSRLLLKDNPLNVSQLLLAVLDLVLVTPWHFLSGWFQGNGLATPFEATNGRAFWNYGEQDLSNNKMEHELTETQLLFEMLMMGLVTGRERSKQELGKLLVEAGFTHYKIIPILGLRSLIEVFPY
ncbi:PREDICTED: trans-resveratrol di-O-methyltransferase-like [Nelumbo nucifera]|uniref:Trans-resveratrol di-O-methyltransferase-like n=1 Tax=Nelumbo nucifera TaxID=4432 RepID=A0A1U8Q4V1_NELNU|nr:PREDICTED: trans-resveratrol di-O-methyltransferase-like [Nelumbo nucifera]